MFCSEALTNALKEMYQCLNPCCSGCSVRSHKFGISIMEKSKVLILVVVDVLFGATNSALVLWKNQKS